MRAKCRLEAYATLLARGGAPSPNKLAKIQPRFMRERYVTLDFVLRTLLFIRLSR